MAFTRDVNLKFNSATKIINEKPQVDKEDAIFQKDVAVTGDLAVTGSFTFAGPPPVWVLAPLTLSNTLTLDGAGALGNFTMDHGDMTLTDGDIVLTNGAITAAVGNISATTGDVLVPAGNVTVGTGNVAIAVAGNFSSLLGDLDLTQGNVDVATGHVRVTTGNIQTTTGNMTVGTGNVAVTTGNVAVTTGHLQTATGDIKVTTAGNISTLLGNIVTTAGDITATNGDITVTQGNLSVLNTVPGTDGNVTVGRMVELLSNAAAVAPAAGGGTLTNDTGELIWRVGAVEQSVTRTGMSTLFGDVNTTDATANVVLTGATYTVAEGHLVTVEAIVHGVIIDTALADKCVSGKVQVLVSRKAAGAAAIIDAVVYTEIANDTTDAAIVASATLAGNVIQITMTGKAATVISWHGLANVVDTVW